MAPVEGIRRITGAPAWPSGRRNPPPGSDATPATGPGRALIAVAPAAGSDRIASVSRRPTANFLAHLIATAQQAPQTRVRRRADPEHATASYRAVAADPARPAGQRFVRSC